MLPIEGKQDDFASLILAYTELTQILQHAHDMLVSTLRLSTGYTCLTVTDLAQYPSKDRSIALMSTGECVECCLCARQRPG